MAVNIHYFLDHAIDALGGAILQTLHRRYLRHDPGSRNTDIHLKVDDKPKHSRGPEQRSERWVVRERTHTCYNTTTRLLHNTNSKSANSIAKVSAVAHPVHGLHNDRKISEYNLESFIKSIKRK